MDTPWDRLVIPKLDRLVGLMTPKCFLDKILARGLITRPEYIIIKSKTAPEQVRHLLIELLPTRPTTAYEEFRQVLQETPEQRHLLDVYFPPGASARYVMCLKWKDNGDQIRSVNAGSST